MKQQVSEEPMSSVVAKALKSLSLREQAFITELFGLGENNHRGEGGCSLEMWADKCGQSTAAVESDLTNVLRKLRNVKAAVRSRPTPDLKTERKTAIGNLIPVSVYRRNREDLPRRA